MLIDRFLLVVGSGREELTALQSRTRVSTNSLLVERVCWF